MRHQSVRYCNKVYIHPSELDLIITMNTKKAQKMKKTGKLRTKKL